jgi:signal transduction histidine kinase
MHFEASCEDAGRSHQKSILSVSAFFMAAFQKQPPLFHMAVSLTLVGVVGVVDYCVGYEFSVAVFYLLPIALGAWFVGSWFAVILSVLSVVIATWGDMLANAHYSNHLVPIWNAVILQALFSVVIGTLFMLQRQYRELEKQVRKRTEQILDISEREQQRIGRDLHDGLCQHLVATSVACEVLEQKLAAKFSSEAGDANRILGLVEDGINMARHLAHGLSPAILETESLSQALDGLTASVSTRSAVECRFDLDSPEPALAQTTAAHLYRIAQEAISNAIRHGHASHITVRLSRTESDVVLEVADDGIGLPEALPEGHGGMGLRIMAQRAEMIGATLSLHRGITGGTLVSCRLS